MAALPFRPLPTRACLHKAFLCGLAPQPSFGSRSSWTQAWAHAPKPSHGDPSLFGASPRRREQARVHLGQSWLEVMPLEPVGAGLAQKGVALRRAEESDLEHGAWGRMAPVFAPPYTGRPRALSLPADYMQQ